MLEARQESPEETPWGCLSGIAETLQVSIDPNGNLTQKTEGSDTWVYSWNAENQLTKVEKNGSEVARFAYDSLRRRVEKVAAGVTTSYTYDTEDVLREVRGATTLKYVHGLRTDEPLGADNGVALAYLHADGLASAVKVTNSAGAVTLTRQYDAWGNPEAGGNEPGYAFTGREWDPDTGLYYYRARYYDPEAGRFTAEDPSGYAQGPNLYVYVDDDPINWLDPSGEAKGGKQSISVTHGGKTLTKSTPLSEIEACLKDALSKGMSSKHVRKLEGLRKVVKRGGGMAVASPYIIDTTISEIDRANRCGGISCLQKQLCEDLAEEGNPPLIVSPMGAIPNPCICSPSNPLACGT